MSFMSYSTGYDGGTTSRFKLILGYLQLDNQLPLTPMPVFLAPEQTSDINHPVFKMTITIRNEILDGIEVCPYVYVRVTDKQRLFPPTMFIITKIGVSSDEILCKECEKLDVAVKESREFMENWSPKMSKICSVPRGERLLLKIQGSSLRISHILCRLFESSPSLSSLSEVQVSGELVDWLQEFLCKEKMLSLLLITIHLSQPITCLQCYKAIHENMDGGMVVAVDGVCSDLFCTMHQRFLHNCLRALDLLENQDPTHARVWHHLL